MCCDGTMHDFARLQPEDVEPARAVGFPTFDTPDGLPAMALPCHCLDGAKCTRYDQWRPSICSAYFCKLQKRLTAGECTVPEALQIIESALIAKTELLKTAPAGTTLNDARKRFGELSTMKQALAPADAKLVVRVFALERMLDLHFRKPNHGVLPTFPVPAKVSQNDTGD